MPVIHHVLQEGGVGKSIISKPVVVGFPDYKRKYEMLLMGGEGVCQISFYKRTKTQILSPETPNNFA